MSVLKKIISRFRKEDGIFFEQLKQLIGFKPKNISVYVEAFTHPTFYREYSKNNSDYQRLEFLGDSVIGLVAADYLFREYLGEDEGYLTNMRSKLVCRARLNEVGDQLGILSLLRYKGKDISSLGASIGGNIVEALVGAIYLDLGYDKAKEFVLGKIIDKKHNIAKEFENKVISYKSLITEWGQKNKKEVIYQTDKDDNDASNNEYFTCVLYIDGKVFAKARDTSKKKAAERVARRAYYRIHKLKQI